MGVLSHPTRLAILMDMNAPRTRLSAVRFAPIEGGTPTVSPTTSACSKKLDASLIPGDKRRFEAEHPERRRDRLSLCLG
jgi:hypothetical protein